MSDSSASDTEVGYADAMAELESILDDLEDDDLDVDVLASRVERASTLITLCRDRIGAARVQVEKIVTSLDADVESDEDDASEADDDDRGTLDLDAD
ncbi:MAG: exodeoxyribonuclease VII small subunit [Acidimicrobiales bacterium]|nr:exodeoxyribonuclease VII small subunit [Acidimicrobiales bacterium]